MASGDDMNAVAVAELWSAVVVARRDLGQAKIDIDLGQCVGGIDDAFGGVYGDVGAQLREELALQFVDALLGVENRALVLFQVGGDVALAVGEGLTPYVVLGNAAKLSI